MQYSFCPITDRELFKLVSWWSSKVDKDIPADACAPSVIESFEVEQYHMLQRFPNLASFEHPKKALVIQILFQKSAISLDDKWGERKFLKISRHEFSDLVQSYFIIALGQKKDTENNPVFLADNIPDYNLKVYAVVHGKNGVLGNGGMKKVKYLTHLESSEKIARSKFKQGLNPCQRFMCEALKKVENVLYINGGWCEWVTSYKTGSRFPILISLYAESDLEKSMNNPKVPNLKYCHEILLGLKNMHAQGVAHRDIKPSNIQIINGIAHLADLDFATICSNPKERPGSMPYVAPETIKEGARSFDLLKKADVYQMGITLYELFNKEHPWAQGMNEQEGYNYYCKLASMTRPQFEFLFPEPCNANTLKHLIWTMKHIDPNRRPDAGEALKRFEDLYGTSF